MPEVTLSARETIASGIRQMNTLLKYQWRKDFEKYGMTRRVGSCDFQIMIIYFLVTPVANRVDELTYLVL